MRLALLLLLAGCGEPDPAIDAVLDLPGDTVAGEAIYGDVCATCHAADGSGGTGPSLIEHAPGHDDEKLLKVMIYGRGGMPAFGEELSDQDLADVLAWMRATFGEYEGHGH